MKPIDYLKKMFMPIFGEELGEDEVKLLLVGNSDESKLFKAFIDILEEQRKDVIDECVSTLLIHVTNGIYENDYPTEAVAKANILSLPALMKLK